MASTPDFAGKESNPTFLSKAGTGFLAAVLAFYSFVGCERNGQQIEPVKPPTASVPVDNGTVEDKVVVDYYPLAVGNVWEYDVIRFNFGTGRSTETEIRKVIKEEETINGKIYTIKTTIGTYIGERKIIVYVNGNITAYANGNITRVDKKVINPLTEKDGKYETPYGTLDIVTNKNGAKKLVYDKGSLDKSLFVQVFLPNVGLQKQFSTTMLGKVKRELTRAIINGKEVYKRKSTNN